VAVTARTTRPGVAGFRLREGARLICETIADYEPDSLTDVRVIAYADEYETITGVAASYGLL
jgi:O-acetyl-ADP-ribose deacetylase (regulator of RNase III)